MLTVSGRIPVGTWSMDGDSGLVAVAVHLP